MPRQAYEHRSARTKTGAFVLNEPAYLLCRGQTWDVHLRGGRRRVESNGGEHDLLQDIIQLLSLLHFNVTVLWFHGWGNKSKNER